MNLDDRMKLYEQSVGPLLVKRCPAILRVDGRAFHTFTKQFDRPYDAFFHSCMKKAAVALCDDISSARFAYGQSDEISVLLTDYENFDTEQWFGGQVQKIVSVSASIATCAFNRPLEAEQNQLRGMFDARVFSVPKEDVVNYFIWRQRDAIRNSILSCGQAKFSPKRLDGCNCDTIREMLRGEHGIDWSQLPTEQRQGYAVRKQIQEEPRRSFWGVDCDIPGFSDDREYVCSTIGLNERE